MSLQKESNRKNKMGITRSTPQQNLDPVELGGISADLKNLLELNGLGKEMFERIQEESDQWKKVQFKELRCDVGG